MKPEYCEVSIKYDKQAKLFWTIRSRELWFISVLLDENIFTSSYENEKGLLHLK